MSLLHSFYCWGTVAVVLLSTGFLHFCGKENWRILACLWAAVPLVNVFAFLKVPILHLTEENEGLTIGQLLKSKLFWMFFVLMITAGASEQALSQWMAQDAPEERKPGKKRKTGEFDEIETLLTK